MARAAAACGFGLAWGVWRLLFVAGLGATAAVGASVLALMTAEGFWASWAGGEEARAPAWGLAYALGAAGAFLALGCAGLSGCLLRPRARGAIPAARFALAADGAYSLRMVARHEAAHALAAAALGLDFGLSHALPAEAAAGRGRSRRGWVQTPCPGRAESAGAVRRLAIRRVALLAAGPMAGRGRRPFDEAFADAAGDADWREALALGWLLRALDPSPDLAETVARAVRLDLDSDAWQAAIAEGAERLVEARGAGVPAPVFRAIAGRFALLMPAVESLLDGGPGQDPDPVADGPIPGEVARALPRTA